MRVGRLDQVREIYEVYVYELCVRCVCDYVYNEMCVHVYIGCVYVCVGGM